MEAPLPRQPVYDLYWYFAAERQAIFERRRAGQPAPWTEDPILARYKFCNVFRASDRVSQYLIRNIIYSGSGVSPADLLFRIIAFRFFSRPETWEAASGYLGRQPLTRDLTDGSFEAALEQAKATTGKLYTGAFILCAADAYGFPTKHQNHLALFGSMFLVDHLDEAILAARSLREIYELLRGYPLIGDFMAYQLAIDLNYSPLIDFDEDDFTRAGPGARRGIAKAFTTTGSLSAEEIIFMMVDRQEAEFARLGLTFHGLEGRRLHAIDCQGLFCELDKYCREALPELTSARSRIKAQHRTNPVPIDYYYPLKWNLEPTTAQRA